MKINNKIISKEEEKMLRDIREKFISGWLVKYDGEDMDINKLSDRPYAIVSADYGYEGCPQITTEGKEFLISEFTKWINIYHKKCSNKKIADVDFEIENTNNFKDVYCISAYFEHSYDPGISIQYDYDDDSYIDESMDVYNLRSLIRDDRSIIIPDSIDKIYDSAFEDCDSLTSVVIGESVTQIGDDAFAGCSGLKSITIPNGVTNIGYNAFYGCNSLTSVIIPNSVTNIENYAFYKCTSLTIYCEAMSEPSGWDSDWNYSNCPVYWYSETKPTEDGKYWHYVNGIAAKW